MRIVEPCAALDVIDLVTPQHDISNAATRQTQCQVDKFCRRMFDGLDIELAGVLQINV